MKSKMKKLSTIVRPFDIIIVVFLFVGSFLPHVVFGVQNSSMKENSELVAIVSIDGEEVQRIPLTPDTPNQEFTFYPSEGQYNIVEVEGTRVRNKEDNSPDQVAVRTGWISQPGQTSVCLPHRLIIEVKALNSSTETEEDVIIPL